MKEVGRRRRGMMVGRKEMQERWEKRDKEEMQEGWKKRHKEEKIEREIGARENNSGREKDKRGVERDVKCRVI